MCTLSKWQEDYLILSILRILYISNEIRLKFESWEFCLGLNFSRVCLHFSQPYRICLAHLQDTKKEVKLSIMLLLVWVECSESFLFMKPYKVRARVPHKPRCHLQSSQEVVQLVKFAFSHVHCLSESSLTLWRLGPLFWKRKLINKHPK